MSTLSEIEAAVEMLPAPQQEELFTFLAGRLGRRNALSADPVEEVIGAFTGEPSSTGRQAEEILYGRDSVL